MTTSPGSTFGAGMLDQAEIVPGRVVEAVAEGLHASTVGGDG
jgi:hypothetical protein